MLILLSVQFVIPNVIIKLLPPIWNDVNCLWFSNRSVLLGSLRFYWPHVRVLGFEWICTEYLWSSIVFQTPALTPQFRSPFFIRLMDSRSKQTSFSSSTPLSSSCFIYICSLACNNSGFSNPSAESFLPLFFLIQLFHKPRLNRTWLTATGLSKTPTGDPKCQRAAVPTAYNTTPQKNEKPWRPIIQECSLIALGRVIPMWFSQVWVDRRWSSRILYNVTQKVLDNKQLSNPWNRATTCRLQLSSF